jgi:hypothetical protein
MRINSGAVRGQLWGSHCGQNVRKVLLWNADGSLAQRENSGNLDRKRFVSTPLLDLASWRR